MLFSISRHFSSPSIDAPVLGQQLHLACRCAGSVKMGLISTMPGHLGILYHIRSTSDVKVRETWGVPFLLLAGSRSAPSQPCSLGLLYFGREWFQHELQQQLAHHTVRPWRVQVLSLLLLLLVCPLSVCLFSFAVSLNCSYPNPPVCLLFPDSPPSQKGWESEQYVVLAVGWGAGAKL